MSGLLSGLLTPFSSGSRASQATSRQRVPARTSCPVDPVIAGIAVFLLLYGLVMVGSASMEESLKDYAQPFYYLARQAAYLLIGFGAAMLVICIPIKVWHRFDLILLGLAVLLLVLVLIPGLGLETKGATRWLPLGKFTLQGSEFVKLFVVCYLAGYLVRRQEAVETSLTGSLQPLLVLSLLVLLLLGQPDFGAAIVMMGAALGMIFLGGAPWRFLLPVILASGAAVGLLAILQPYRLVRLATFLDPWSYEFGSGYQLTQALIAFGRGEWLGLGLGNSIQKLFFLPEPHTDFLFSIIAEELGILGAGLVLALFAVLVIRALMIGFAARNKALGFHAYLAYGIALILGIQAAINLSVNLGILPTKGLPLPLVSYGGNSLIVSCMMIAILLRIHYETQTNRRASGAQAHG